MSSDRTENRADEDHDEKAMHEADRKMLLREDSPTEGEGADKDQPAGESEMDEGHDEGALKQASERMLLRDDRN
ncbi:MAG TPA: hypothetical protein VLX59_10315 [Acidimicrobiales bacterium]|nr:hypothetical protein [Acidimicrobiales bacterium]